MNSKERVLTTFQFIEPDRVPCWLGASPEFMEKARRELNLTSDEEVRLLFGDDFRRVTASYAPGKSNHLGNGPFGIARKGIGYGMAVNHPLSDATIADVENFNWPDPMDVDISNVRHEAGIHYNNYAILGGDWSPFWHDVIDLIGMEPLFIKMYTDPELISNVFNRVVNFYFKVSTRIFEEAADLIDIFFIGNDFGSQTGPLIDEALFNQFISPHLKRLTDLGHQYKLKVMLHCCGGFRELIPSMIDAGLDGIHAVQPSCRGMNLKELKKEFGDKIVFNGCIDSHHVLINGTPEYVRSETKRTLEIMKKGGGFIAGASHDYILEETPVENVLAMFETIHDYEKYIS